MPSITSAPTTPAPRHPARQVEHRIQQHAFHDGTQAAGAGLAFDGLAGHDAERIVVEGQLDIFHLEQPLILLDQRVLRFGQDPLQRILIEILKRGDNRQTADESGIRPNFSRSSGSTWRNTSPTRRSSGFRPWH